MAANDDELSVSLELLIDVMRMRLGYEPSENQIMSFIFDDESTKQAIWNSAGA